MTRRKHRRGSGPGADEEERPDAEARMERIVVFEKTKMCKFHIMGVCTKGDGCRFAHDRLQLQTLPDLSCTKLCKTLIATGVCNNPACRYAHNKDQLRGMPDPSTKVPLSSVEGLPGQSQPPHAPAPGGAAPMAAAAGVLAAMQQPQQPQQQPQQPQQAGRGTAPLLAATGPCGVVVGQPMAQGLPQGLQGMLGGQGMNPAVMNAAILQIGQAAQAHAAEAARLQVMVATLQDGSQMPAAAPAAQILMQGGGSAPGYAVHVAQVQDGQTAPAVPGGIAYSPPPGQPLPGAVCRGGAAKQRPGVQIMSLAEELGGPYPNTTGSSQYWRQESGGTGSTNAGTDGGSGSAEEMPNDEHGNPTSSNQGFPRDISMSDMTVKNTFLDFRSVPSTGALRAVQTASGRLDLMCRSQSVDMLDSYDNN